ncbi:MAG: hypothetical protein BWY70_01747 [Bacteroidetes bacterium ADurb.Bin408]|nr:MAG: hypothetical protein BWY70_01747 [Bacteroidetes bacterium ADurb.Bin408]
MKYRLANAHCAVHGRLRNMIVIIHLILIIIVVPDNAAMSAIVPNVAMKKDTSGVRRALMKCAPNVESS